MLRHSLWLLLLLGSKLAAAPIQGFYTTQGDWELACDNTGTCRAAGYANEEDSHGLPVSLLLQRAAGERAVVSSHLQISYQDNLARQQTVTELRIDNHTVGRVVFTDQGEGVTKLPASQTQALLAALKRRAAISLHTTNGTVWRLSANGATAILRRMDAFQRRNGTPSALINPGHSRRPVLQPQPLPIIHAAAVPEMPRIQPNSALANSNSPSMPMVRVLKRHTPRYRALVQKLRRLPQAKFCEFVDSTEETPKIEAYRLSGGHILIRADCMHTASNGVTQFVTVTNRDFSRIESILGNKINESYRYDGIISNNWKERGFGDCWGHENWIWNGRKFSLTYSATDQMCRGFAGGAWTMPTFISLPTGTPAAEKRAEWIREWLKEYAD
ncbi:DUF1176 domain-containing protein [Eikenella sp. NML120348]|uniref:DUF1176 domain-containing protein n=1 Tax=Eikenella sp. NML120348 TaxID=1795831 RepID=UPI0007DEB100|nr:DUF1176 domain-containing protein [Eikenella sp. NML120348]OAM38013.1 hypothetical protein A7P99_06490 [Eikenella sp. NML120348]